MTNEEAKNLILSIDRFSYVDMISLLGQDACHIDYAGEEGIIARPDKDFMSVASFTDWHDLLPYIDTSCSLICVHDEGLRNYLMEHDGYENKEGCYSYSWWKGPLHIDDHDIRILNPDYLETITNVYAIDSEDSIRQLLADGRKLLDEARKAMFMNALRRGTGHAEIRAFDGDDGVSLGHEAVSISVSGIRYVLNASVFFQSNPSVLPALLSFVRGNAQGETIMDLYSGVGTFSALFEGTGKRVYAVERDKECLSLSKLNAPSALSFTADVALWGRKNGRHVDTVIVDPPRTGLSSEALSEIVSWKPDRIIYVSCNSSTLARDVSKMEGYRIMKAAVFDFYPGTGHDESALVLDRME